MATTNANDLLAGSLGASSPGKAARRFAVRKTSQQSLLYLADHLSKFNERFYTSTSLVPSITTDAHDTVPPPSATAAAPAGWQSGYLNIVPITAEPSQVDTVISRLASRGEKINKFFTFDLTSAQMALLVPKIRVYKLDYTILQAPDPKAGTIDRETDPTWREIVFEKAVTGEELSHILKNNGGNIGSSGIENFSWALKGVNPAEVDSNIEARLKVYFNNVNAFQDALDNMNGAASTGPSALRGSFIDLITFAPPLQMSRVGDLPCLEKYEPRFFEIMVEVGWSVSSNSTPTISEDQIQYIEDQTVCLYLTLTDHKFDFAEDGSATLEANYRARTTLLSGDFDILNPPQDVTSAQENVRSKEAEIGENTTGNTTDDEKILEQRENELRTALKKNYTRIINEVLKNVYEAEIPNELLLNGFKTEAYAPGDLTHMFAKKYEGTLGFNELFAILGQTKHDINAGRFYGNHIEPIVNSYQLATSTALGSPIKAKRKALDPGSEKALLEGTLTTDDDLSDEDHALVNSRWIGEEISKDWGETSIINFLYLGDIIEIFTTTDPLTKLISKDKYAIAMTDFRFKNAFKILEALFPAPIRGVAGTMNPATEFHLSAVPSTSFTGATVPSIPLAQLKCKQAELPKLTRASFHSKINMANIPVNLELFLDWITDRMVATDRVNYYLEDFLNDLFNHFVKPMLASIGGMGTSTGQPVMINCNIDTTKEAEIFSKTGPKIGISVPRTATSTTNEYKLDAITPPAGGTTGYNYINSIIHYETESQTRAPEGVVLPPAPRPTVQRIGPPASALAIKRDSSSTTLKVLGVTLEVDNYDGNYSSNISRGINNFLIGLSAGSLKSAKFERVDQPGLRESRTAQDKNFGTGQLRELYNVSLTLYGNNLISPGQIIYVEPNSIIFGRPTEKRSVARILGLGGYHLVVDVQHEISSDGWETKVKALHMAMPATTPVSPP